MYFKYRPSRDIFHNDDSDDDAFIPAENFIFSSMTSPLKVSHKTPQKTPRTDADDGDLKNILIATPRIFKKGPKKSFEDCSAK